MDAAIPRSKLPRESRPYEPFGTAEEVFYSRDRQIVVVGPAGTGKSRGIIEKIHYLCCKYRGLRVLWLRKTRKSLTESAMVTFEEEVLPEGSSIKAGAGRDHRPAYHYPNRSTIVLCGLDGDNVDQVMSTQWDIIYAQECIEIEEDVWDKCDIRLRNGQGPYHQLIGDTNPGPPTHWIKNRIDAGDLRGVNASHTDNPRYWDRRGQCWTAEGEEYLASLRRLKGHLGDRYCRGLWVAAAGSRWPELDRKVQGYKFKEKFPHGIPSSWPRIVMADYGLRAPYCALWAAIDHDGDAWMYRERYRPGAKCWEQAREILDATAPGEIISRLRMDPAMWQEFPAHERDANETGKSVFDYYQEVIGGDPRFGPIEKGFNKSRQLGQITIDNLLARDNDYPNLWIDDDLCPNLWTEIENAVWSDKERKEDIDPKCPDHAITALIYGLHGQLDEPAPGPKPIPTPEVARQLLHQEMIDADRKNFNRRVTRNRL